MYNRVSDAIPERPIIATCKLVTMDLPKEASTLSVQCIRRLQQQQTGIVQIYNPSKLTSSSNIVYDEEENDDDNQSHSGSGSNSGNRNKENKSENKKDTHNTNVSLLFDGKLVSIPAPSLFKTKTMHQLHTITLQMTQQSLPLINNTVQSIDAVKSHIQPTLTVTMPFLGACEKSTTNNMLLQIRNQFSNYPIIQKYMTAMANHNWFIHPRGVVYWHASTTHKTGEHCIGRIAAIEQFAAFPTRHHYTHVVCCTAGKSEWQEILQQYKHTRVQMLQSYNHSSSTIEHIFGAKDSCDMYADQQQQKYGKKHSTKPKFTMLDYLDNDQQCNTFVHGASSSNSNTNLKFSDSDSDSDSNSDSDSDSNSNVNSDLNANTKKSNTCVLYVVADAHMMAHHQQHHSCAKQLYHQLLSVKESKGRVIMCTPWLTYGENPLATLSVLFNSVTGGKKVKPKDADNDANNTNTNSLALQVLYDCKVAASFPDRIANGLVVVSNLQHQHCNNNGDYLYTRVVIPHDVHAIDAVLKQMNDISTIAHGDAYKWHKHIVICTNSSRRHKLARTLQHKCTVPFVAPPFTSETVGSPLLLHISEQSNIKDVLIHSASVILLSDAQWLPQILNDQQTMFQNITHCVHFLPSNSTTTATAEYWYSYVEAIGCLKQQSVRVFLYYDEINKNTKEKEEAIVTQCLAVCQQIAATTTATATAITTTN